MEQYVYIGTYTNKTSRGIYGFSLNVNGIGSDIKLVAEEISPTYLCVNQKGTRLYAVGEPAGGNGFLCSYSIDPETHALTLLNKVMAPCLGICHVVMDPTESWLLTASYRDATVQVYPIKEDGTIGGMRQYIRRYGCGPHPVRQPVAHAHSNWFTPDGRYVITCDLGTDELAVYDWKQGLMTENPKMTVKTPAGYGPRHIVFHPNGRYMYVVAEIVDRTLVYSYDPETGFELIQDADAAEREDPKNTASAIRITKNGKHLYVTNRGENTITQYLVQDDGTLQINQRIAAEGEVPRDCDLDLTEKLMICTNQNSDTVSIYDRDPETGILTLKQVTDQISMPVAVVMIEK